MTKIDKNWQNLHKSKTQICRFLLKSMFSVVNTVFSEFSRKIVKNKLSSRKYGVFVVCTNCAKWTKFAKICKNLSKFLSKSMFSVDNSVFFEIFEKTTKNKLSSRKQAFFWRSKKSQKIVKILWKFAVFYKKWRKSAPSLQT